MKSQIANIGKIHAPTIIRTYSIIVKRENRKMFPIKEGENSLISNKATSNTDRMSAINPP